MRCFLILIGVVICFQSVFAQGVETDAPLGKRAGPDSTNAGKKSFFYKPKLVLGIGGHNSLTAFGKVKISGFRVGVEFNKRIKTGWGIYALKPPIYGTQVKGTDTLFYNIHFSYLSRFVDLIFYSSRWWELSIPHVIGIGGTTINVKTSENDEYVQYAKIGITLYEASILGYFKPLPWIGMGLSIGYRNVNASDEEKPDIAAIVGKAFDGPNWAFKFKLYLGVLTKSIFKGKKAEENKEGVAEPPKD